MQVTKINRRKPKKIKRDQREAIRKELNYNVLKKNHYVDNVGLRDYPDDVIAKHIRHQKKTIFALKKTIRENKIVDPITIQTVINKQNKIRKMENEFICRKRSTRRKSLFSKGKIGKGKKGPIKKIYTRESKVRC